MRAENSLRRRLITACVLLAVVIGGTFVVAGYVVIEALEHELINTRVARAAQLFLKSDREGMPPPNYLDLQLAVGAQIPAEFNKLGVGSHQVIVQDRVTQVLIAEEDGQRYAVIGDMNEFERLEHIGFAALGIAFVAGVLLALLIARASASRIIAPLTVLAETVQRDDLAEHSQLLTAADEIGLLARAFHARASHLKEFLKRERMFTADVSHELRTPLTVMLGAAELLILRLENAQELQAIARRIHRTAAETSMRVSALLQLARMPEAIECKAVSLRPLIEQEIDRCRSFLDGKPVPLTFESPAVVSVYANPDLVAIAVSNLLRNACYFTERGSVRVLLSADTLVIEDTGPGVPQEVRRRLFEPFVRGRDDSSTGSGLGLFIVKRVAEHLGWSIRLDDAPTGGSRLTLTFGSRPDGASTPHLTTPNASLTAP